MAKRQVARNGIEVIADRAPSTAGAKQSPLNNNSHDEQRVGPGVVGGPEVRKETSSYLNSTEVVGRTTREIDCHG